MCSLIHKLTSNHSLGTSPVKFATWIEKPRRSPLTVNHRVQVQPLLSVSMQSELIDTIHKGYKPGLQFIIHSTLLFSRQSLSCYQILKSKLVVSKTKTSKTKTHSKTDVQLSSIQMLFLKSWGLITYVSVCRDLGTFVKRNKNQLHDYMTIGPARLAEIPVSRCRNSPVSRAREGGKASLKASLNCRTVSFNNNLARQTSLHFFLLLLSFSHDIF